MYFPDLSPYGYFPRLSGPSCPTAINVGWLDGKHECPRGDIPEPFAGRLWAFCRVRVVQTRGMHECELCAKPTFGFHATRGDEQLWLGSAEIRVFGKGDAVYAAPNMIYHYVANHRYRPPEEFIQAVLESDPAPDSCKYEARVKQYDPWFRRP